MHTFGRYCRCDFIDISIVIRRFRFNPLVILFIARSLLFILFFVGFESIVGSCSSIEFVTVVRGLNWYVIIGVSSHMLYDSILSMTQNSIMQ